VLAYNNESDLKQTHAALKQGHKYFQKEIGSYLYNHYTSFMKTSESIKNINHEFEELKTMLN